MSGMSIEERKRDKPHVTAADITRGLREIGLRRGDLVVVHSSLSAFGHVEGGADAVIDGLLDALGEEGTLVMPTFHEGELYRAPKDPLTTPSKLGTISDVFCHRAGVYRGDCNLAAIGPLALEVLIPVPPPPGRPKHNSFYKIVQVGGRILLLGIGHGCNSTIHTAQALAIEEVEGVAMDIYEEPGGYEFAPFANELFDAPLIARGHQTMGVIGEAQVRLVNGKGLYEVTTDLYRQSDEYRAHTREYLAKIAQSRREVLRRVQELTSAHHEHLQEAERLHAAILRLRYILMGAAEEMTADRESLAQLMENGDLRLFADQLQGRLIRDFEATMKVLQDERFATLIEEHLGPVCD